MADTVEPAKKKLIQAFLDALRADDYQKMQESLDAFNVKIPSNEGADQVVLRYQYEVLMHSNVQLGDLKKLKALSSFDLMSSSKISAQLILLYSAMVATLAYQENSGELLSELRKKVGENDSLQALEEIFGATTSLVEVVPENLTNDEQIACIFFFLQKQDGIKATNISSPELKKLITGVVNRYNNMTEVKGFTSDDWVIAVKQKQKQQLDAELQALGDYYAKKLTIILDEIILNDQGQSRGLTEEEKLKLKDSVMSNSEQETELRGKLSTHPLFGGKFQRYYDNLSALHQCKAKLKGKTVIDDGVSESVDVFVTKVKANKPSKTEMGFIDKIVQFITLGVKGYYTPPWKTVPSAEGLGKFRIFKAKVDEVRPDDSVEKPDSPGASS